MARSHPPRVFWFEALARLLLCLAAALAACDDPGDRPAGPADATEDAGIDGATDGPADGGQTDARLDGALDARLDGALDARLDGALDARPAPDAGDAAPPLDAGPDGPPPGPEVDPACLDACDRYAECGRLDAIFGDRAACLTACQRMTHRGVRDMWIDCIAEEPCPLLQACPTQGGRPLDCDETCAAAAACGADRPHCLENCLAAPGACGDVLIDGRCAVADFDRCVGEALAPPCEADCAIAAGCGLVERARCVEGCVADRMSGDPLGHRRSVDRGACIAEAGDCAAVQACVDPPTDPFADVDRAYFCALYESCGLDALLPCPIALRNIDPFFECGIEQMELGCPFDGYLLIDRCVLGDEPHPRSEPCRRLCEARALCGDGDESPAACVQRCMEAGPDADARAASDALLPCGARDRCDGLRACLDAAGPEPECAAYCASLDACGLAPVDCPEACVEGWARDRARAARACVAGAADCAEVAACAPAPLPPCADYCARLGPGECFLDAPAPCLAECDDLHFADPSLARSRIACALTASRCGAVPLLDRRPEHDVLTCAFDDPADHGSTCARFCDARICRGAVDDPGACLRACGEGLVDDEGLRFVVARTCLDPLPADAPCDATTACVPDELETDCAGICADGAACGIEDPGCLARCADDPLGRLRALRAEQCLASAADCDAVAGCLSPTPFEPDPGGLGAAIDEAAICAAFDACPEAPQAFFDCASVYQSARELGGPSAPRCVLDELERCDAGLTDIGRCFDHPLEDACVDACEVRRFCRLERLSQERCQAQCRERYAPLEPGSLDDATPWLQCAAAPDCPALRACMDAAEP